MTAAKNVKKTKLTVWGRMAGGTVPRLGTYEFSTTEDRVLAHPEADELSLEREEFLEALVQHAPHVVQELAAASEDDSRKEILKRYNLDVPWIEIIAHTARDPLPSLKVADGEVGWGKPADHAYRKPGFQIVGLAVPDAPLAPEHVHELVLSWNPAEESRVAFEARSDLQRKAFADRLERAYLDRGYAKIKEGRKSRRRPGKAALAEHCEWLVRHHVLGESWQEIIGAGKVRSLVSKPATDLRGRIGLKPRKIPPPST